MQIAMVTGIMNRRSTREEKLLPNSPERYKLKLLTVLLIISNTNFLCNQLTRQNNLTDLLFNKNYSDT